jgi:hypothetical protein
MLRQPCGYKLANDGIDTCAIQDCIDHPTTRYTAYDERPRRTFWVLPGPPTIKAS